MSNTQNPKVQIEPSQSETARKPWQTPEVSCVLVSETETTLSLNGSDGGVGGATYS